jgi:hybrid polyketide synthase/nonribosomal peptide synthetase ACE1
MVYKVFDVTKEPSKQSLTERAYDLVIASNVLHATPNLEQTLTNVRKLLKPGGYLVMLEVTDTEPLRPTFFFGCLPDWWVGEADGRQHHPLLPAESWGEIFRKTGFSGLDSSTPKHKVFMAPFSVMLTQAVDNQMEIIRQPLGTANKTSIDKLLVLGGSTLHSYEIAAEIKSKLDFFVKSTTTVETLELLTPEHFGPKQVVLSLLELDGPIFEPFTPQRYRALQLLTERSRNVVWVVRGSSGDQPYSNMMAGVSRCLVGEQPEMQFQIIDFDMKDTISPGYIAESLLRMVVCDSWRGFVEPYCPVWTLEREIRFEKGNIYIPRYIPNKRRDMQYNSWRRTIRESVDAEAVVTLTSNNDVYDIERCSLRQAPSETSVVLVPSLVSTRSVQINSSGRFFIAVGQLKDSSQQVLAFSEDNASKLIVKESHFLPIQALTLHPGHLIRITVEVCLGDYIISRAPSSGHLLVHEPSLSLAQILNAESEKIGLKLILTTNDRIKMSSGLNFTYFHPSEPDHSVARSLPSNITGFVDVADATNGRDFGSRIALQLSPHCLHITFDNFSGKFVTIGSATRSKLAHVLGRSLAYYQKLSHLEENPNEISSETAVGAAISEDIHQVMNWTRFDRAQVRMFPVEDEVSFKSDKTYLL